jgi:hypothetical protein
VVVPNGIFVYRSHLHGGLTAEVLRIWNGSNILKLLKGSGFPDLVKDFKFSLSRNAEHGAIPKDGVPAGTKIFVVDAAYHRSTEELKAMSYLPTKVPENGDNPQVIFFFSFFLFRANKNS